MPSANLGTENPLPSFDGCLPHRLQDNYDRVKKDREFKVVIFPSQPLQLTVPSARNGGLRYKFLASMLSPDTQTLNIFDDDEPEIDEPEIDYKKLYEDLLKKNEDDKKLIIKKVKTTKTEDDKKPIIIALGTTKKIEDDKKPITKKVKSTK